MDGSAAEELIPVEPAAADERAGLERPVYCDGWFPRQHNYHPSLPARRLRMVEELVESRATMLVWAALGGGSLSLPYLEQEAFGEIDPRFRFYGFLNDSEFVAECQARGIDVFGVVFEIQGWEFPVELDDTESRILALNELRGVGRRGSLGLREFSSNRYPNLWPAFEQYFPGGLTDADGEPVVDLIEQCCSRDIDGKPCHAHWVECPDREHACYAMDRNDPAWREYLKAVIRIQVDAGVAGIHLDEAELPLTTRQYGGCFCSACTRGFRDYLVESRPAELDGADLSAFDYGAYLRERGFDFKHDQTRAPLFAHYFRYQRAAVQRHFAELADYARDYAAEQGRTLRVSGNFFDLMPLFHALAPSADLIVTEMRTTAYRQPGWYRYAAGFAAGKPLVVVENPYGGVVPELVEKLGRGRGYDLFRLSLYEAAAMGARMSVPYGAWLGAEIEDAFWPPHELVREIQDFVADNERLYSAETANEIGVVFSVASALRREERGEREEAYHRVAETLAAAGQPFDVVVLPDGELRHDLPEDDELASYRLLVLAGCDELPPEHAALVARYEQAGGRVTRDASLVDPQVTLTPGGEVATNLQRIDGGVALHLVNYDYDESADAVRPLMDVALRVRLEAGLERAVLHRPGRVPEPLPLRYAGGSYETTLPELPLYAVVELR